MPRKRKNKRSDGRIQLSAVISHDASGKLLRKYFYGKTRLRETCGVVSAAALVLGIVKGYDDPADHEASL